MDGAASPERRVAFRVLRRVSEGAYADRALSGEAAREHLDARGRAQAHRLAFGAVQRRRTLDWLVDEYLDRPEGIEDAVRDVLRLGAYDIAFSDAVRDAAAVDQAVRLSREIPGGGRRSTARAGLVNAVLRKVAAGARDRLAALDDADPAGAAIFHSVPDWVAVRLFDALGPEAARGVLVAANQPGETAVRWNPLRGPRATLERLLPAPARRDPLLADAYVLDGAFALEDSAVWRRGLAMAQSRASMLPALALEPRPGERILDLCAAPGAKATQIAAMTQNRAEVVCVELHPARASALRALAARLGARVTVVVGDGRDVALDGEFDAVLVDPPCTGLGVLSARPDARWRRTESDLGDLSQLQAALLARAVAVTRPGGRVVYSTCTLLPDENERVVGTAGHDVSDLTSLAPASAHPRLPGALLTLPGRDGTDGFFVARIDLPGAGHPAQAGPAVRRGFGAVD
jgi:16S rRNA (cytosine967-C5)-methyltransferase